MSSYRHEAHLDAPVDVVWELVGNRIFDATAGPLYFRRWSNQSLAALRRAARSGIESPGP